jgi:hypothetical protein
VRENLERAMYPSRFLRYGARQGSVFSFAANTPTHCLFSYSLEPSLYPLAHTYFPHVFVLKMRGWSALIERRWRLVRRTNGVCAAPKDYQVLMRFTGGLRGSLTGTRRLSFLSLYI